MAEIDYAIVSRAHNWVQSLPLKDNMLVCVDCGHRQSMKPSPGYQKRCRRKVENILSGYSGPIIATEYRKGQVVRFWVAGRAGRWLQPWNDGAALIYGLRMLPT